MGMSMAVSTLVGQNIGAGNIERAARITWLGTALGFAILTRRRASSPIFAAPQIVAFFIPSDAAVIAEGAHFIRIMCLAWGGIGVQFCIVSAFRASGNMLIAMVIAHGLAMDDPVPAGLRAVEAHGAAARDGIWWSFPVTNVAVAHHLAVLVRARQLEDDAPHRGGPAHRHRHARDDRRGRHPLTARA